MKNLIVKLEKINKKIESLTKEKESLTKEIQNKCSHEKIEDLTTKCGRECDNGYGRFWKLPYFKCLVCNLVQQGYSTQLEKLLKKQ